MVSENTGDTENTDNTENTENDTQSCLIDTLRRYPVRISYVGYPIQVYNIRNIGILGTDPEYTRNISEIYGKYIRNVFKTGIQ